VGFLPFFPLESGLLTGKVSAEGPRPGTRLAEWPQDRLKLFITDHNLAVVERLSNWVSDRDRSLLDLAFSWLLSKPEIPSVIAGATSSAQVLANSQASGWSISSLEMDEINDLLST
jgi:aryl-alcohol dehydrogenase-like predicted oxidoreductase